MSVEIFCNTNGRALSRYDLLDDIQNLTGLPRTEAHAAIHAILEQLVDIDGDDIILSTRPDRPELLQANPHDLDINTWLTIADSTAQEIRDALAAQHATEQD